MKSVRIKNQSRVPVEIILAAGEEYGTFRHVKLAPRNSVLTPSFSVTEQVRELARRKQIQIVNVN